MIPIPKRNYIIEEYKNITMKKTSNDTILIFLKETNDVDYADILTILRKYRGHNVDIRGLTTCKTINSVIKILSRCNYDGKVFLSISNSKIKDLDNHKNLIIEEMPSYAKIKGFLYNNKQTPFTTWAHNLSDKSKRDLISVLDDGDIELFNTQEDVMYRVHDDIVRLYPNIMSKSPKERFEIIFDYIGKKYPYSSECLNETSDGVTQGNDWSQNAVETYRRGRGVCQGRANLLTLATNNNLFRLKCTTVSGYVGLPIREVGHEWNIFMDEFDVASNYDLSFSRKNTTVKKMLELGYKYKEVYPCVYNSTPPVPPKRNVDGIQKVKKTVPLPPRHNQENQ
jgi:hypothetical protein